MATPGSPLLASSPSFLPILPSLSLGPRPSGPLLDPSLPSVPSLLLVPSLILSLPTPFSDSFLTLLIPSFSLFSLVPRSLPDPPLIPSAAQPGVPTWNTWKHTVR